MEQIKGLTNSIDSATSDMQQAPNPELYSQVEKWILTRADMPKHCVAHVSKRLMIKNDKVTLLTIDLLEYIIYVTELPFWTQICTKEFLLKISQILQSKDRNSAVSDRVLQFVKSEYELFKPHQDLLPTFFQFYEGLVSKGFDQKGSYVSPYRPKQLKKYATKAQTKPKSNATSNYTSSNHATTSSQRPSRTTQNQQSSSAQKNQKYTIDGIRQRIVLTNEIIDECNPAQQVKNNNLLIQMMTTLKQIQKSLNNTISEGCDEKTMEESIALNDDLIITFRRFKDLQKNKRPEPFVKTELASDYMVKQQPDKKKSQQPKSIFDQFGISEPQPATKITKPEKKTDLNIFDFDQPNTTQSQTKSQIIPKAPLDIFDMDDNKSSVPVSMNTMSVPMQNVPNFNSQLLGLNISPPTQAFPAAQPPTINFNTNQNQGGFNFSSISGPPSVQLGTISMGSNSGFTYNNQFGTQIMKKGDYTQNDLIDLTDMFSKKL